MEEIDVWRSAHLLIEEHGPDAIKVAARRQVELLSRGEEEGAQIWGRIILAINALMRGKPMPDEAKQ